MLPGRTHTRHPSRLLPHIRADHVRLRGGGAGSPVSQPLQVTHGGKIFTTLSKIFVFRSVWWLPHSYNSQAMNFYLIDVPTIAFSLVVLGRRLIWLLLRLLIITLLPVSPQGRWEAQKYLLLAQKYLLYQVRQRVQVLHDRADPVYPGLPGVLHPAEPQHGQHPLPRLPGQRLLHPLPLLRQPLHRPVARWADGANYD